MCNMAQTPVYRHHSVWSAHRMFHSRFYLLAFNTVDRLRSYLRWFLYICILRRGSVRLCFSALAVNLFLTFISDGITEADGKCRISSTKPYLRYHSLAVFLTEACTIGLTLARARYHRASLPLRLLGS
jgi:hypothetical protein